MENDNRDVVVVASLVVQARETRCAFVRESINAMAGASVTRAHQNKLAVVLEVVSTDVAAAKTEQIRSLDGVTGVELVAHFFEEEVMGDGDDGAPSKTPNSPGG